MSASATPANAPGEADRRNESDRRSVPDAGRRGTRTSPWLRWLGIGGRDLGIVIVTVAAIVFSVRHIHPIFANQPTIAAELTRALPGAKAALAAKPGDTSKVAQLVSSPQFEKDRAAFAADLVKTGRMDQARADSISYYAVREAYLRGIPPAVVFGVMLTENAMFVSSAMSNVGAVGLMQVYPKIWLKALGKKFGTDLASDSTNLKYGVYILSQYIKSDSGKVTPGAISSGLLHYNGCVHGSNTHNCHTYPTKVKTYVEKQGNSLCGDKSFYQCIAKPFIAGLFGKSEDSTSP
ncbi:MAG TPA: lytic transglycosylase domain-containing protein [Gemmatimonadaceae bacterium]|nr:lytic transglycosylase domain-containing protein [Gemmatimonadaceae bacterium]